MKLKINNKIYWFNYNFMILINGLLIGIFFIYCHQLTFPILVVLGLCFMTILYAVDINKEMFVKKKFNDAKLKNYCQCLLIADFLLGIMCGLIVDIDTTVLIIVYSISGILFIANTFASYSYYWAKLLKYKKERHNRFKKNQDNE